jgi:hypothetical protein
MASQSLIAVITTVGDYENQWVRVLIYIMSSCNLYTVACRSSTALYTMVVLRHVHGYTLAPSYYIGYQTKNICEVMSEICKFCNSHLSNFPDLYIKETVKQWLHRTYHTIFVVVCLQNTWQFKYISSKRPKTTM